tara:strand:+ start:1090 stop:1965 length:876 start_codon:yes stop_codon:yes gene_type:complete
MKPIVGWAAALLCLLATACVHTPPARQDAAMAVRAMTFNIRLDIASDGENAWPNRKEHVFDLIRHEAPDVLGMQEVLLDQKCDLEAALPGYAFLGVARDDGREAGEFSPLAYRTDRFVLIDSGTFWLSPTPDVPGKGWDAAYPRIATWARLRDRTSGKEMRVLNTHFDHVGAQARAEGASQIARWVAAGAGQPTIAMGDFNSAPDSEPYRRLTDSASSLANTRTLSRTPPYGPRGTFTAFDISRDAGAPIDHIFVTREFTVASHAVITQHWGGKLPSDHYPVLVVLETAGR